MKYVIGVVTFIVILSSQSFAVRVGSYVIRVHPAQAVPVDRPEEEEEIASEGSFDVVPQFPITWPAHRYDAPPLLLEGCLGTNVRSAHNNSPGLQDIRILPGESWSFNENWVIAGDLVVCNVYGGGVCNEAGRYSNVARNLGLNTESQYHGYDYDSAVPSVDNLAIWSSGGRGGQDLIISNTTNRAVRIAAHIENDQLLVSGWLE